MAKGPGDIEVYRSMTGAELAVVAPTWLLKPEVTFESLALEFQRDPEEAWKNYGSQIKAGSDRATDPDLVDRQANRQRLHPWNDDERNFASWFRGDPGVQYAVHIDLAKNHDRAGVALVHRDRATRKLVVDFCDGVVGRAGRDVQIADCRDLYVYGLTSRGFNIVSVSLDQWNSLDTIQQLTNRGYVAGECSADKKMEVYDTFLGLLKENQVDYYLHPLLIRELQELRRYPERKKYDHPKGGSKDVSDAVACATFKLVEHEILNPYTPSSLTVIRQNVVGKEFSKMGWD